MKFCGTCKEQVADHLNFCPECGSKVEIIVDNTATSYTEVQSETKPVKSKKNLFLIIGFVIIAALLFGAYKFGANKFSKEKQVNVMIEAFQKKDINEIAEFVKAEDPSLKVKTEDIKAYIRYLKENPSYNKELLSYLQKETVDQKLTKDKASFKDGQIVEDGKEWFLYPKYKFSMKSYYMNVSTTAKNAEIYVNDKKEAELSSDKTSKELGPYFPGTYVVKAAAKTELTELETEEEVDLADEKSGKVEVDLSLEGNYVTISSDESDATVFVNGKKRGKLTYGSYELGPVATDETVEVHLEKTTNFGVVKSESITIGDQSTYYLKFPKETSNSAVGDFVRNHIYDNVRAIALNDFSLIENNYDKSGKSYKEDRDYLQYLHKKGITEDLLTMEIRNVERQSETKYKVTTYEEYHIRYGDGSVKFKSFSNEHFVTVNEDGTMLYHSLGANNTLKSEDVSGPTR
ncbi:zinc ribbon domain-containing protein [Bacillus cereus]|uniref:zinc ribbon domain-containing protein n=1 Tax=Bacillus cereus TaxID=1396 RepID=UPI000534A956|nr:zinc ribbon domain-containing protein [Bacillus cereus]PEA11335.1 zinc ribbon domain-containing protein [Bacillus cereus]PFI26652.1 zinc ribbon domain-containing protein [Bacillus cereus]